MYKMKILALVATLFFAYASEEAFFGALRIDAASNERLGAARAKIQTHDFDIAALQGKIVARTPQQPWRLQEYDDSTLLESTRQRDTEISAYEDLATRLFLEHSRAQAAFEDVPTNLAPAPLVGSTDEWSAGSSNPAPLHVQGVDPGEGGVFVDAYASYGVAGMLATGVVLCGLVGIAGPEITNVVFILSEATAGCAS